jgi:hypothetical protein
VISVRSSSDSRRSSSADDFHAGLLKQQSLQPQRDVEHEPLESRAPKRLDQTP